MLGLFVIYGGAGLIMWFVAHQMAPVGREFTLSKAVLTVIVMGGCSIILDYWLKPLIGPWRFVPEFASDVLVVKLMLELTFWRSVLAVIIYWAVIIGGIIGMTVIAHSHP